MGKRRQQIHVCRGQDEMLNNLKTFKVCNPVEQLNFLLYGLVGAGKSSTINTIRSIFEGRLYVNCLAAAGSTTSQTLSFGSYNFKNDEGSFPFAFYDVMGAEAEAGVNTQDIISALKGHMKEGYKMIQCSNLTESKMGSSSSKPDFLTVLSDMYTAECGNKVTLHCEANTKVVIATWEKDGSKLLCVEGKHKVTQEDTKCVLEIFKVDEKDEGKYTLNLKNKLGSESCSTIVRVGK
ncbi:interferon-induced protein 44-like isoform X2 [Silurus meridionalis]|nr:interferon-induced protein 44-like isoform X2 [Silurus meridionalis]